MSTENESDTVAISPPKPKPASKVRLLISLLIGLFSLWFITRSLKPQEIGAALANAHAAFIGAAALVILLTMITKTLRWQLLFAPPQSPPLRTLFPALVLGQFINALSPFRVGDLARIYAVEQPDGHSKVQVLSTLVVEKTFDLITLLLTLALVLPAIVTLNFNLDPGYTLIGSTLLILVTLFTLAYQTDRVIGILDRVAARLPDKIRRPMRRFIVGGLRGLSALRNPRRTLLLMLISAITMLLSIATPYALFLAFDLPLGLTEATLVHISMSLGLIPASTPGNIGIFEGLVVFVLHQFGLTDEAVILGYAIVYHLVVVVPQVILGSIALARSNWQWPNKKL